ncbi:EVE domain-containing protein [Alcaligenaceae bacterium]|nr:EVE domain-containing protein [Alcaligenaceae bacterium]
MYRGAGQNDVQAICIFTVQVDERIDDAGRLLHGPALKLCTVKVGETVRGRKIGELFLRAAFQYATSHQCAHIFLHANATQQDHLTSLLEDFGFYRGGVYEGDAVFVKDHPVHAPAVPMPPFEYVRRYYPHYNSGIDVRKFIVPIQPRYHDILFPDCTAPGRTLPANHPRQHVGNAIKLAYLSNAPSNRPRPGDVVLFYRSRDQQAITTLGVVERYEAHTSAEQIAQLVSRRTVYSMIQIADMAKRTTKVMLFRLIQNFEHPVTYNQLQRRLRVVRGHPQSITEITDESFSRILRAADR